VLPAVPQPQILSFRVVHSSGEGRFRQTVLCPRISQCRRTSNPFLGLPAVLSVSKWSLS